AGRAERRRRWRRHLSPAERDKLWRRWRQGEALRAIARARSAPGGAAPSPGRDRPLHPGPPPAQCASGVVGRAKGSRAAWRAGTACESSRASLGAPPRPCAARPGGTAAGEIAPPWLPAMLPAQLPRIFNGRTEKKTTHGRVAPPSFGTISPRRDL